MGASMSSESLDVDFCESLSDSDSPMRISPRRWAMTLATYLSARSLMVRRFLTPMSWRSMRLIAREHSASL